MPAGLTSVSMPTGLTLTTGPVSITIGCLTTTALHTKDAILPILIRAASSNAARYGFYNYWIYFFDSISFLCFSLLNLIFISV